MFTPKTICRSVHERGFTAGQKIVENPGLGRGAAGPGLRAGGQLAGRKLRAAGLLFAKPFNTAAA